MLEIEGLGKLTIRKDGIVLGRFGSSKAEALLVYLAYEGRQHSRSALSAMFWPESSEKQAQISLRVALSTLRKYVGEYLEITREFVGINPRSEVRLDIFALENLVSCGDLEGALALYRGEWLQDLNVADSRAFENWRRWEQEHAFVLLVNSLQKAVGAALASGEIQTALLFSNRLIQLDPLNEIAQQLFLTALALDGKRNKAIDHYQKYISLLMEELELPPEPETESLIKLIIDGDLQSLKEQLLPQHNIPNPITSFVGRTTEIHEIRKQLGDSACRLVTLAGPGGVGKTRLAVEISKSVLVLFKDGVYFVPLGDLASPDHLTSAIAAALGFNFEAIAAQLDSGSQLVDFLRPRTVLIVLDEYENFLETTGLITDLLLGAPNLKIMVTSRQVIGVAGEWVHLVKGLPVRLSEVDPDANIPSLDLFMSRAQQVNQNFNFSEVERESALRICELVDGLPLGIELAAGWASLLSCAEIAAEIEKSYGFLVSPSESGAERHRSLSATFDHSWRMLGPELQKVLSQLSVFQGNFTRRAAKTVADASSSQLSGLAGHSLLNRQAAGSLSMHRAIRQFSTEKLFETIEDWRLINHKHSQYYLELLAGEVDELEGPNMVPARQRIREDLLNLQAAIRWAIKNYDQDQILRHLRHYFSFYLVHGWLAGAIEFKQLANAAKALKGDGSALQDPVYLFIQVHLGYFLANLGRQIECEMVSGPCLKPLQKLGMTAELAMCLHNLGTSAEFRGEYQLSGQLLEEAIEVGQTYPSAAYFSFYLWLGYVYFLMGKYEDGMRSFTTCLQWWHDQGNHWAAAFALSKMGLAADGLGRHAAALEYHQQAMRIFLDSGDIGGQAYSLGRMSIGAYFLEEYDQSASYAIESLRLFEKIGHRWGSCASRSHLGYAYLGQRKIKAAEDHFRIALERSVKFQLSPLILYALAGIAVTRAVSGWKGWGRRLFDYVQRHPKTPTLYVEMARRWFSKDEFPPDGHGIFDAGDLEDVVRQVFADLESQDRPIETII